LIQKIEKFTLRVFSIRGYIRKQFDTNENLLQGLLFEFSFRYSVPNKSKTFNEMLIIIRINEIYNSY
jgi:hypothetical protein